MSIDADAPDPVHAAELANGTGQSHSLVESELAADEASSLEESAGEEASREMAAGTEPHAKTSRPPEGRSTTPLPELESQRPQDSAPLLPEGALVGNRYQVIAAQSTGAAWEAPTEELEGGSAVKGGNTVRGRVYDVVDLQGHLRCWACGSGDSGPGDTYCTDCGAQLTGRHYRLQEFPGVHSKDAPHGSDPPIPQAVLENRVHGVAHVYDVFEGEEGTLYVVWEQPYGRTLASMLPTRAETGQSGVLSGRQDQDKGAAPEEGSREATQPYAVPAETVPEEHATVWISHAAEILANLHAQGIVGCSIGVESLLVQPGDRLLLQQPSGCRAAGGEGLPSELEQLVCSDVRNLGVELENWYLAVRSYEGRGRERPGGGTPDVATENPGLGDTTDSLDSPQNLAVVLARAREGSYPTAEAFARELRRLRDAHAPLPYLSLWSGRASDVGLVRALNEDSIMTLEANVLEEEGHLPVGLYVIADGMGGHESGEVASSIAVRTIGGVVNSSLVGPILAGDPVARDEKACMDLLRQAVVEANRRISDLAEERQSDLGTTVVAALVVGNQAVVANVGDSRAYVWHHGRDEDKGHAQQSLSPVTRDHSLVAQLVAAGQISQEEIYTHPRRNEIYRALGDPRLTPDEVDVYSYRLQPGDGLLLCSDGLWDFVRDPDIARVITERLDSSPQAVCDALIDLANEQSGEDNISVLFVRVLVPTDGGGVMRET